MPPTSLPPRCVDLTADQVVTALASSVDMRRLLEHMARIAKPGEGAAKILVPIARMATTACGWLDDGLYVEITGSAHETQIRISVDLGVGMREALFPRLTLGVPMAELVRAIERAPRVVHPLRSKVAKDKITLTCTAEAVRTVAPPAFEIAEESIRKSLPAKLRRSLPPVAETSALRVDVPFVGEATLLARSMPKAPRTPSIVELDDVDAGWEASKAPSAAPAPAPAPGRRPLPKKIVRKRS